jgi:hypothetical protein
MEENKTNNLVAKHARKYNKAAVHKDRKKAMKKGDRKHKGSFESVEEVLKVSDGASAWIKDFQSSDAPQFKGKSMEKRKEMALAAYLDAKKGSKEESVDEVFTTTAIANFFRKSGDKKKYDKVVKSIKRGKYTVAKATQMFDLDGRILQSMVAEQTNEDLRKWFGKGKSGDWVRVGTDGEIKGDCARDEGEGKPKCMPRSKAHGMSKKDRASAARRKRAKDPTVDRPGTGNKPIMVKTKKESIEEKNEPTNPKLWAKFKAQAKSKFDVYPSAYANGWAAKQYKAAGGGWKTVKEGKNTPGDGNPCWDTHKKVGTKMKNGKRVNDCVPKNESAQDRLDRMAKKHGLGKPNKAADDYLSKMMKKYGAKDMADLKKKMGMKEETVNELTQRDLDRMAARKDQNLAKRGKGPKKPKAAGRVSNVGRGKDEADDNLIMQLRKAQDKKGKMKVKFRGGETQLPINLINKLLATHDKLQKPQDKKKLVTMITHELRKRAGTKDTPKPSASDKAMSKFQKSRAKGIPAPRGKGKGPSDSELRDIERGK